MSVVRVNHTTDYTVMSNVHLRDRRLSLKAKGLLSQMLSLPDDWDYTIEGLASINLEQRSAIASALKELQACGYLIVTKLLPNQTDTGRIEVYYDIYETPQETDPTRAAVDEQCQKDKRRISDVENHKQLNTNKQNTDKPNTKEPSKENKRFAPPTVDEVRDYCQERGNGIDAEAFVDYYSVRDWKIKGQKIKDWKACVRTWERFDRERKKDAEPAYDVTLDFEPIRTSNDGRYGV